jgi:O-antigen ligase
MTLEQYVNRVHVLDTGKLPKQDAFVFGGLLAAGLAFLVPVLAIFTHIPVLVWVAVVGVAYGTGIFLVGRVGVGLYAALLVTMTFIANVPLASADYLRSMSGSLGPNIWLAHGPLLALLVVLFFRDSEEFYDVSRAETLLGAFVGWVVLAAFVVRPPRLDTALFFALFVLSGSLILAAIRRSHRILQVSPRTTMSILACTIFFKSCFALVEGIQGKSFGLTHLGELSPKLAETLATIPVASFNLWVGTYVSGFTGMSFLFASLVVLVLPFALSQALSSITPWKVVGSITAVFMAAALRLTGTDAGRGAALLAMTLFLGWVFLVRSSNSQKRLDRNTVVVVAIALVCIAILLVPSTQSGAPASSVAVSTGEPVTGGTAEPASADTPEIALPLFDLSSLGIRLSQYVAGIGLFIENPIFGIGGANFPYLASEYGIPNQLPIHNVYIALLAETGIIGFALYCGFLLTVLWQGIKITTHQQTDTAVRVAALSGIVGYLGFMFWDYILLKSVASAFPFYAVCAVLVADGSKAQRDVPEGD